MAKNLKIRRSVTSIFSQTPFFKALQAFLISKWRKNSKIRLFLTTSLLKNCFVYIFAESGESAVRPRKTERISRQNVAAEF